MVDSDIILCLARFVLHVCVVSMRVGVVCVCISVMLSASFVTSRPRRRAWDA